MKWLHKMWQSFRAPNDRVIHQEPKNGTVWKPWTSCFGAAMVLRKLEKVDATREGEEKR